METRICRIFLALVVLAAAQFSQMVWADENTEEDSDDVQESSPLVEPYILRLDLDEAEIDTENFEVGVHYGRLSVEDFGTEELITATAAYHVTEDFFIEAAYSMADLQQPAGTNILPGEEILVAEEDLEYVNYNLALGYHIFPGEVFIWRDWAFNSQFFLIGGVGTTEYLGDVKETTLSVGAGFRLILWDWLALRVDVRDHIFKRSEEVANIFNEQEGEVVDNIEVRGGVSFFF